MQTILIIEDEKSIADTVIHSVEKEGYAAEWHVEGLVGLERAKQGGCVLVVLDVGLPDINGFELCRRLRAFSAVPVIFLTARDDEIDKVVGLEIGADDYMTKPFSPRELGARIKSVLRRAGAEKGRLPNVEDRAETGFRVTPGQQPAHAQTADAPASRAASTGGVAGGNSSGAEALHIDADKMVATWFGKRLDLTRYEFRLLALLAEHPGRVYSRETLMGSVWGDDSPSLDRTVDAHIKSLRAKCKEVSAVDPFITRRGIGYALRDDI